MRYLVRYVGLWSNSLSLSPTAVIESDKTTLMPGTVQRWSKWSLPLLLVNVPTFKKYYQTDPELFNDLCLQIPTLRR